MLTNEIAIKQDDSMFVFEQTKKSDRYSIAWKQPLRLFVLQYSEIEYAIGNVQIDIGNVGSSS